MLLNLGLYSSKAWWPLTPTFALGRLGNLRFSTGFHRLTSIFPSAQPPCYSLLCSLSQPTTFVPFIFQYYDIRKIAIGTFGFFPMSMEERPGPMLMCVYKYNISHVNAEEETYELSRQTDYCILKKYRLRQGTTKVLANCLRLLERPFVASMF